MAHRPSILVPYNASPMRILADESKMIRLIDGLAGAIEADKSSVHDAGDWAIVGIRSRGDVLARRLAERVPVDHVGTLDITLYRDDLSEIGPQAVVRTTEIDFSIDGLQVVLVDDVLMTGRSVRAALQSLMDLGRPRRVWLSVLVDRGGRELPVQPDHVALDLSRADSGVRLGEGEHVDVLIRPTDDRDAILVRAAAKGSVT